MTRPPSVTMGCCCGSITCAASGREVVEGGTVASQAKWPGSGCSKSSVGGAKHLKAYIQAAPNPAHSPVLPSL